MFPMYWYIYVPQSTLLTDVVVHICTTMPTDAVGENCNCCSVKTLKAAM